MITNVMIAITINIMHATTTGMITIAAFITAIALSTMNITSCITITKIAAFITAAAPTAVSLYSCSIIVLVSLLMLWQLLLLLLLLLF